MTDLSRGARSRRSGRRPGWLLLTVLLVLAIAASSALVFTERVELLKLAVILSLWAAATAAFVSVIYRRQSDVDRAKARDLKLVYDLQLDREISARREYQLEVESQLRRELATELRAQAADEVSALRAELAALRTNLEILFDTDLSHRPAIEPERTTVRAYSDWQRDGEIADSGTRETRFVASTPRQDADDGSENAIIDVPEEPPVPAEGVPAGTEPRHTFEPQPPPASRWDYSAPDSAYPYPAPDSTDYPYPAPDSTDYPYSAPDSAGSPYATPWVPPQPPEPQPAEYGGRHGVPTPAAGDWQPTPAEGQWLPPGTPGTNWAPTNGTAPAPEPVAVQPFPDESTPVQGRHSSPVEPYAVPNPPPPPARHSTGNYYFPPPAPTPEPAATPVGPDTGEHPQSQHGEGQGQSVAELLARLQAGASQTEGGRRRRRDG